MYVKDRIVNKARSWNGRRVNPAGKEVLTKSVLLTIPTYVIACVKISRGLCRMLNSTIAKKKIGMVPRIRGKLIHWMAWERMTEVKGKGGLGFRDLETFNLAMLAKQAWRLEVGEDSLFFKVFKAQYFPTTTFLKAQAKQSA